ncbi:helix-turn-helix domain-containing protein [Methylobacterium oryzae]
MTVTDAVNRSRVALARDLIAQTDHDLERVAERAGFGSARHMRRVWRQFHAAAPSSLRARSSDEASAPALPRPVGRRSARNPAEHPSLRAEQSNPG